MIDIPGIYLLFTWYMTRYIFPTKFMCLSC